MRPVPEIAAGWAGKLIVSCQASAGDAFYDPGAMARFAAAAVAGGAAGIRANGAADIRAIRQAVAVPVIGIEKVQWEDGGILITPSFEGARELVRAGAALIALDCTARGQRSGALDRARRIRSELGIPVLADIASLEEAAAAAAAGCDFVLSTLCGYTAETVHVRRFEPEFIRQLARAVDVPVIAEGRIETPAEAAAALDAGAYAVVVGSAITRPHLITARFAEALASRARQAGAGHWIGIDLGGTNTKAGIVGRDGSMQGEVSAPTPFDQGPAALLDHLARMGAGLLETAGRAGLRIEAVGIATAGWVDPGTGRVAYATGNLPGWTGTPIADTIARALGLPVAVENDANALAIAEKHFGAARHVADFVCLTLGTGVGGGCYVGGRLNRGRNFFANALGHICVDPDGLPCTCGARGCLEVYANAAALVRYAGATRFATAEQVMQSAHAGDAQARSAVAEYARRLARGCASIVHLLDPEALILSGGLAQNNPWLVPDLVEHLAALVTAWPQRNLRVCLSPLGYYGGVLGAAACAMER